MKYLISPNKKQYKANLHCHSVLSDGNKTPEELKKMYKEKGYSILAITDHERPGHHPDLADEDFILLTGYEAYIRPDAKSTPYVREIHMNLFAKDPDNVKMIGFDPRYCRYLKRDGVLDQQVYVGEPEEREYSREYINHFIRTAKENGYLVSYNHGYWSMEDEADILAYEGCFSMEMFNFSSYLLNALEYNGVLYDKMLRSGKRIFCHSADDNHNKFPEDDPRSDSFGGYAMILPEEFTYEGIIRAMEEGEMYSSMGPRIHALSVEGNLLHVECSPANRIIVFFGGKRTGNVFAAPGETVTAADIEIPERARYVRVCVIDEKGNRADTRGYFRDEIGFPPLEDPSLDA